MTRAKEDQQLIKGCLQNKRKAQNELFHKYAGYLLGIAKRYAEDEHKAKDIFLCSFERIFKNLAKYNDRKGSFKSWIRTITVHEGLNHLRNKNNYSFAELSGIDMVDEQIDLIKELDAQTILDVIHGINEPYRTIFNLVLDGYKHSEIARQFDITVGTSRSYFYRSKKMIIQQLKSINIVSSHEER